MSSARTPRSRHSANSMINDDQINDLVSKLQQLLPEIRDRCSDKAKILQETWNSIRSLHRELDDMSERLSELLANSDNTQADLIRSLLRQLSSKQDCCVAVSLNFRAINCH